MPFLIDTGSSVSLIDKSIADKLPFKRTPVFKTISAFKNRIRPKCWELQTPIVFPNSERYQCNVLAIKNLSLKLTLHNSVEIIKFCHENTVPISPNCEQYNSSVKQVFVQGILGCDLLEELSVFEVCRFEPYNFFRIANGYVPFGSCKTKISQSPLRAIEFSQPKSESERLPSQKIAKAKRIRSNIIAGSVEVSSHPKSHFAPNISTSEINHAVNFVFSPKTAIPSPLEQILDDSSVEQGQDGYEKLYALENLGIVSTNNFVDDKFIEEFEKEIVFKDGHYYVAIPWKPEIIDQVPHNFELSKILAKKVYDKNVLAGMEEAYFDIFSEQLSEGIIERIPPGFDPQKHKFIPHRAVVRPDVNTTKIRVVYNCSLRSRKDSPSLNDAAFEGVDLLSNLFTMLIYFRTNSYCLLGDIRKAFLNIRLKNDQDKNFFSFCVFHENEFHYFRFNTIIFGFISSPWFLNYIVKFHAKRISNPVISDIVSSKFYVDNLAVTNSDESSLSEHFLNIKQSMSDGGFKMQEWCTNSTLVTSKLEAGEGSENPQKVKFLGLQYNSLSDSLSIKNVSLNCEAKTKRQITASIASIFDPLGLLNPVMLSAKFLLREISQTKVGWDTQVPVDILSKWQKLCTDFDVLSDKVSFQRKAIDSSKPVVLNCFSDASKNAYSFVVYATQGEVSSFVYSKARLSPLPAKTLPSLELLACYTAILSLHNLCKESNFSNVNVCEVNFYLDSQVSLAWLLSRKATKKNIFVNNRLKEITSLIAYFDNHNISYNFEYVPTDCNIADILTKPISCSKYLQMYELWLSGPNWLKAGKVGIPKGNLGCIPTKFVGDESVIVQTSTVSDGDNFLDHFQRFSSYSKLLNVYAVVFMVSHNFKTLRQNPITYDEAKRRAFIFIFAKMQEFYFPEEINFLKLDAKCSPSQIPKLVKNFHLFLDSDNLLRSRGRVSNNLMLSFNVVNPVMLAGKSHLAKLLIRKVHIDCKHLGVNAVLNSLRQGGIWLTTARGSVRSELQNCTVCKLYNYKSKFKVAGYPDLPSSRVNLVEPFSSIGIDFTGAFTVIDRLGNKMKLYILIFVCMSTRAIHMEVVDSMDTASFILAFVRHCNLRGLPNFVLLDNAKSFISGSAVLTEILTSEMTCEHFKKHRIKFHHIPVYSPWMGASYERLIGIVKSSFYKTFGRKKLDYFNFITSISDIELIVNNRPLTYRSCQGELEILTPNHLISTRSQFPSLVLSSREELKFSWDNAEEFVADLLDTIKAREVTQFQFYKMWFNDYLLSLREKTSHNINSSSENIEKHFAEGSIVIFKSPNKAKSHWQLARIIKLIRGSDNESRSAVILKPDKSEIRTSLLNLVPLEIQAGNKEEVEKFDNSQPVKPPSRSASAKSVRAAAKACQLKNSQLAWQGAV